MYDVTPEMLTRLHKEFTYQAPKDDQPDRYVAIRNEAFNMAMTIVENSPPSREQSLALTNLKQAIMWANAAIAVNE